MVLPAAVAWGYYPLIRDIISAGAEVNAPECEEGKTALTVAVERRDVATIQLLIDAGADVNASAATLFGRTALEAAVRNNDIDTDHYLLDIGADPDDGSLIAAVSGSAQLMQMLLTARLGRYRRFSKGYGCGALQRAIKLKNAGMVDCKWRRRKRDHSPETWQRANIFQCKRFNHLLRRVCSWNCDQNGQKQ